MKKLMLTLLLLFAFSCAALAEQSLLSADGSHVLALDAAGDVWAWGSNQRGESAPNDESERILTPVKVFSNAASVFCGQQFSMALTNDNALFAWGDNRLNQIPGFSNKKAAAPTLIFENIQMADACDSRACALTLNGDVLLWGDGEDVQILTGNAIKCAVGLDFTLALKADGSVYEYADGAEALILENCADIDASGESRYALTKDGRLMAWGAAGADGRLGFAGANTFVSSPVQIAEGNIDKLRAGLSASGYLSGDGQLHVWGTVYSYVQHITADGDPLASLADGVLLNYGSSPLALYDGVLDAAFGDAFVAVLFTSGDVLTWGSNDQGQLGGGAYTETNLWADDESEGYELSIAFSAQSVFPIAPIRLSVP